jgi:hypothetical protein
MLPEQGTQNVYRSLQSTQECSVFKTKQAVLYQHLFLLMQHVSTLILGHLGSLFLFVPLSSSLCWLFVDSHLTFPCLLYSPSRSGIVGLGASGRFGGR